MVKTVLIHVGLPKTGTSTFQALLKGNAGLLSANGVDFVGTADFGKGFQNAARLTVRYGSNVWHRFLLRREARKIARVVLSKPGETVIVSEENLMGWRVRDMYRMTFEAGPRYAAEALSRAFAGHKLLWVLCERDARAHMWSSYRYFVKLRGVASEFEEWAASIGTPERLERLIVDARAYFGANGRVFNMDDEIASPRPFGAKILEYAGLAPTVLDQLTPVPAANQGLPEHLLPFVRKVNGLGLEKSNRQKVVAIMQDLYRDTSS